MVYELHYSKAIFQKDKRNQDISNVQIQLQKSPK